MQKITPSLWFDKNCEEAVNFYISVFNGAPNKSTDAKIISIQRYEEGIEAPGAEEMLGKVLTVIFELNGQRFMALDGGPLFQFNEAISFYVECQDQSEVDYFWGQFTKDGGEESMCGWLKDKFGLSWQIVPRRLGELMESTDKEKAKRVMNAMLKMRKIVVKDLEDAAN